jgi:hypothetical protein
LSLNQKSLFTEDNEDNEGVRFSILIFASFVSFCEELGACHADSSRRSFSEDGSLGEGGLGFRF